MSKTLRRFLTLAFVAMFALLLVGCGQTPDGTQDGNKTKAGNTDYDHTIVFYSTQGDNLQKQTEVAIKKFEAKYPGWKVEHVPQGGYDDCKSKIVSDLQGQLQPDLAYCYADHVAQYIQTKKVVDLSLFINSTETVKDASGADVRVGYTLEQVDDFVPGYYAEGYATNYGDYAKYGYSETAMLTLPFVKSTELLYVNEDALIAAGFKTLNDKNETVAKVATTWDDLWAQGDKIKEKFPSATLLGYDSEANWFITMCEQNGWGYTTANSDNHYLFNNENTKSWLESLNGYYEKGFIVTQMDYGAYTSNLFTKGADDGGVVYCVGSSGGASYQATDKFKWGVYAIPGSKQADGSVNSAVISQGPSLCMFYCDRATDKDEKATMTFMFLKELLDPTFQASFSIASGYNPCTQSSYNVEQYVEHLSDSTKITAVACQVAKQMTNDFFTSPAFVGSSTARDQVGNALNFAVTGGKSAQNALLDAYKNCGGK